MHKLLLWLGLIFLASPSVGQARLAEAYQHALASQQKVQHALIPTLNELEQQYDTRFSYDQDLLQNKKVDNAIAGQAKQGQKTLEEILRQLLTPLELTFEQFDEKTYVIYPDNDRVSFEKVKQENPSETSLVMPSAPKIISPTVPIELPAEQTVSGKVTDLSTDEPLPGVNILAKGTSTGTVTDVEGNYRLTVADDVTTLVFSSIGFETLEEEINGRSMINIALSPDIQSLSEVVVVGYGAVEKRDLTGAVSKIEGDELTNLPAPRVDQLLQGRAPGVNVTSVNGAPGARASIRIRGGNSVQGDNEPLYVIDGFIAGTDFNLNNLNVNDIESIDILKDASAISIYGTRGANGVILITTKDGSGATGGKPNISFNAYTGTQSLLREVDFLNGIERAAYGSEYAEFSGESNPFVDESLIADTDWQDLITRTAPINNIDLSVSGNTENVNYYISGNYLNQRGIIENSGFSRYNVRTNLDFKLAKWAKLGARVNATYTDTDNSLVNLWNARLALTSFPAFQEDGSFWDENYVQGGPFDNPLASLALNADQEIGTNLLGNFYLEIEPIEGLTIRSTIGPQLNWEKRNVFESSRLPSRAASQIGGRAELRNLFNVEILQENTITYNKEINENHRFNVLGGFTWQTSKTEFFSAFTDGLPNDGVSFDVLEVGNPETFRVNSDFRNPFQIVSWLGRVNYTLKDKYLFTVAGRVDGSSRFSGANNQYAFFPSAAFAWRLGDEQFIQNLGVFDDLKFRASYGVSGSQAINAFSTRAILDPSVVIFNNTQNINVRRDRPDNPELRWETTRQFDIGLEAGFFNNRLTFELDYYRKTTVDLLLNREIPRQTGFDRRLENIGSLRNQGMELMVNSVNVDNDFFKWSTTLTLAGNRSEVLDLGGVDEIIIYNLEQGGPGAQLIVGEPVGVFTGLNYLGTWRSQAEIDEFGYDGLRTVVGGPRFRDTSDDGTISFLDDFSIIGDPEPTVFGGINNSFQYKNFTLDVFFQGTFGNNVYNEFAQRGFFGRSDQNIYRFALNRWTEENPNSDIPRAGSVISIADVPSNDELVEDGTHLRLRNVRLAYQVPTENVSWLRNLSVYVTGNNLLLFSNFRGYDPEATRIGPDNTNNQFRNVVRGVIRAEYPTARSFTIGLNANF
ncbi:SusC/RagA family TonB-linked outer membrane protein [Tunicatimonas pelagia]|uniref:SusC/RagA family TonB-linked outer membrane protein n=1 Tax=Tunicatimonas pelagia TaxID=931531 RepID=UPI0026658C6A|nr:SusC/RagA family TonB-linked outer membrane protein [Tunicatimonas pelagia]WKN44665.1 SusC/RagA family TonB-linked outer membrane protein [Tunicatimonas pelagia]